MFSVQKSQSLLHCRDDLSKAAFVFLCSSIVQYLVSLQYGTCKVLQRTPTAFLVNLGKERHWLDNELLALEQSLFNRCSFRLLARTSILSVLVFLVNDMSCLFFFRQRSTFFPLVERGELDTRIPDHRDMLK